jgi:hypothetical protein
VHKIMITNGVRIVVQEGTRLQVAEPVFAIINLLLAECKVDALVILMVDIFEGNVVTAHISKILFSLLRSGSTKTYEQHQTYVL